MTPSQGHAPGAGQQCFTAGSQAQAAGSPPSAGREDVTLKEYGS